MGSRGTRRRALAWYRGVTGICWLLNDSFLVTAGAPLGTPRVCEPGPGQLILDQADGQFSIVAGEFTFPVQTTPAWGDQEWHALQTDGDEYDVLDQKKLILKFRGAWLTDDSPLNCWFGFSLDTTPDTVANAEHTFYRAVALGGGIRCTSGASDNALALRDLWDVNLGAYFQTAIVLRPYTAGGLHWYPEAAGVFAHGAHFFWRDEAGADSWRLAWYRQLQSRTDPLYPAFSNYDAAGKFDYVRIPCDDEDLWNPLFTPIAWDEFTDTNGVLLPNHTITYVDIVGLVWVSEAGVWQITGNEADPDGSTPAIVTVHTLTPDIWGEVAVDAITEWIGLTLRKSADTTGGTNHWMLYIKAAVAGVDTYITEFNDGAQTHRASADIDWADQSRNIRVRADDEQITLYVDYVERLHYALGWFNKHATWHGLYAQGYDAARFDNFIVPPRGTGLARICFDSMTDINITALAAHTPDEGGQTWVEDVGAWQIWNNQCDPDATANSHCHVVTTESDVWIESYIDLNGFGWVGLCARKSADTGGGPNYWYYVIQQAGGNDVEIGDCIDGAFTQRFAADTDVPTVGNSYYVTLRCLGQVLTGYLDGTQRAAYGTATFNQAATWHGLYNNAASNQKFDQFRITEIPALGEYDVALNSF